MSGDLELTRLPEAEHIALIGERLQAGYIVSFITENEDQAERYVTSLLQGYSPLRVISRTAGPVKGTIRITIGPGTPE